MYRILPAGVLLIAALLGPSGCIELDLGATPFFCNNGTPPCPYGYTCVTSGNKRICVKEGLPPPKLDGQGSVDDKAVVDVGFKSDTVPTNDGSQTPDMNVADYWPSTPDMYIPPDLPPVPDQTVKKDVFKLGCQNNKECKTKDPQNPCCCPVAILWVCAPLCLNPFCLPL